MKNSILTFRKYLIRTCLVIQFGFITGLIRNINGHNNYFLEAIQHVFFSTTAINHQFNFFTFPNEKKIQYSYFRSAIYLLRLGENEKISYKEITENGSIDHLVKPVNRCRIANVIPVTFRDTLLFEAIVRSEALYFLNRNPAYKALGFEIYQYNSKVQRMDAKFVVSYTVDTVYKKIFFIE